MNGCGYAVGVFYGDVLLYAPALLRLAGVPVSAAYDAYLFGITPVHGGGRLLCGPPAWRRALRVRGRGGAVHPFGIPPVRCHRPCGPWGVHGLAFLPLVAAGFWRTLRPDRARLPGWALLVIGLSGVLQSHLLSFEMTVLLLALAALLCARQVFSRAAFGRLAGAAGVFCALNAGFLLPLLDYYLTGKFAINQPGGVEPIQANARRWASCSPALHACIRPAGRTVQGMAL